MRHRRPAGPRAVVDRDAHPARGAVEVERTLAELLPRVQRGDRRRGEDAGPDGVELLAGSAAPQHEPSPISEHGAQAESAGLRIEPGGEQTEARRSGRRPGTRASRRRGRGRSGAARPSPRRPRPARRCPRRGTGSGPGRRAARRRRRWSSPAGARRRAPPTAATARTIATAAEPGVASTSAGAERRAPGRQRAGEDDHRDDEEDPVGPPREPDVDPAERAPRRPQPEVVDGQVRDDREHEDLAVHEPRLGQIELPQVRREAGRSGRKPTTASSCAGSTPAALADEQHRPRHDHEHGGQAEQGQSAVERARPARRGDPSTTRTAPPAPARRRTPWSRAATSTVRPARRRPQRGAAPRDAHHLPQRQRDSASASRPG